MINWFDMPDEGLSNGGLFEVKELEVTENGTYETKGEMYNKVVVNVEGGGGGDLPTATVVFNMTNHANNYFASFSPTTIRDNPGRSYSAFYTSNGVDTSLEVSTATKTVTVILDRTGQAILTPDVDDIVSLEGSAEFYNDTTYIVITGDAVINFTGYPVS